MRLKTEMGRGEEPWGSLGKPPNYAKGIVCIIWTLLPRHAPNSPATVRNDMKKPQPPRHHLSYPETTHFLTNTRAVPTGNKHIWHANAPIWKANNHTDCLAHFQYQFKFPGILNPAMQSLTAHCYGATDPKH